MRYLDFVGRVVHEFDINLKVLCEQELRNFWSNSVWIWTDELKPENIENQNPLSVLVIPPFKTNEHCTLCIDFVYTRYIYARKLTVFEIEVRRVFSRF